MVVQGMSSVYDVGMNGGMHESGCGVENTLCIAGNFGLELKFSSLVVFFSTTKLKFAKLFFLMLCMAILYRTSKFKSANVL